MVRTLSIPNFYRYRYIAKQLRCFALVKRKQKCRPLMAICALQRSVQRGLGFGTRGGRGHGRYCTCRRECGPLALTSFCIVLCPIITGPAGKSQYFSRFFQAIIFRRRSASVCLSFGGANRSILNVSEKYRLFWYFIVAFPITLFYNGCRLCNRSVILVIRIVLVEPEIPQNCGNIAHLHRHRRSAAPGAAPGLQYFRPGR